MLEPPGNNHRYGRRAPQYTRIQIIPGVLYLNFSRSGISFSLGKSGVGRASVSQRGVRLNKNIGGFNIGKTFSFSSLATLARLFGLNRKNGQ
ncbi:MAG: DUF4236 domain-containing protein [Akkermansia sp.]|nr:DUF4236 domain-containing protein [Akkermansia sp.]